MHGQTWGGNKQGTDWCTCSICAALSQRCLNQSMSFVFVIFLRTEQWTRSISTCSWITLTTTFSVSLSISLFVLFIWQLGMCLRIKRAWLTGRATAYVRGWPNLVPRCDHNPELFDPFPAGLSDAIFVLRTGKKKKRVKHDERHNSTMVAYGYHAFLGISSCVFGLSTRRFIYRMHGVLL